MHRAATGRVRRGEVSFAELPQTDVDEEPSQPLTQTPPWQTPPRQVSQASHERRTPDQFRQHIQHILRQESIECGLETQSLHSSPALSDTTLTSGDYIEVHGARYHEVDLGIYAEYGDYYAPQPTNISPTKSLKAGLGIEVRHKSMGSDVTIQEGLYPDDQSVDNSYKGSEGNIEQQAAPSGTPNYKPLILRKRFLFVLLVALIILLTMAELTVHLLPDASNEPSDEDDHNATRARLRSRSSHHLLGQGLENVGESMFQQLQGRQNNPDGNGTNPQPEIPEDDVPPVSSDDSAGSSPTPTQTIVSSIDVTTTSEPLEESPSTQTPITSTGVPPQPTIPTSTDETTTAVEVSTTPTTTEVPTTTTQTPQPNPPATSRTEPVLTILPIPTEKSTYHTEPTATLPTETTTTRAPNHPPTPTEEPGSDTSHDSSPTEPPQGQPTPTSTNTPPSPSDEPPTHESTTHDETHTTHDHTTTTAEVTNTKPPGEDTTAPPAHTQPHQTETSTSTTETKKIPGEFSILPIGITFPENPPPGQPTTDQPITDQPTTDQPTSIRPTTEKPGIDTGILSILPINIPTATTKDKVPTSDILSILPVDTLKPPSNPSPDPTRTTNPTPTNHPPTDRPPTGLSSTDSPTLQPSNPSTETPPDRPTTLQPEITIETHPTTQPTKGAPTEGQPTHDQPTHDQPTHDQPTQDQPTQEHPTQEHPTQDHLTQEQPTQEQPTQENPAQEEPTTAQPGTTQRSYTDMPPPQPTSNTVIKPVSEPPESTLTLTLPPNGSPSTNVKSNSPTPLTLEVTTKHSSPTSETVLTSQASSTQTQDALPHSSELLVEPIPTSSKAQSEDPFSALVPFTTLILTEDTSTQHHTETSTINPSSSDYRIFMDELGLGQKFIESALTYYTPYVNGRTRDPFWALKNQITVTKTDAHEHPTKTETQLKLYAPQTTVLADIHGRPTKTLTYYVVPYATTLRDSQGQPTATRTLSVSKVPVTHTLFDEHGTATRTITSFEALSSTTVKIVTATPTAAADSGNIQQKTALRASDAQYFGVLMLPTLLAIALAIPIRILDRTAKLYQPFHAMTSDRGAPASESLCLETRGPRSLLSFRSALSGQILLSLTGTLVLSSAVLIPLSGELIHFTFRGPKCVIDVETAENCALAIAVLPHTARAMIGIIAFMLILLCIAVAVLWRWQSGVAKPWSLHYIAHLATNIDIQTLLRRLRARDGKITTERVNRAFSGMSFILDYWKDNEVLKYGILIQNEVGQPLKRGAKAVSFGRRTGRKTTNGHAMPFFLLTFAGRLVFISFLCGVLVFALVYHIAGEGRIGLIMIGESIGVRILFTVIGVLITFVWESFFHAVAFLSPFRFLNRQGTRYRREAARMTPPTNVFSGVWTALARRPRDPYLGAVAVAGIFAELLPLLLSGVPFEARGPAGSFEQQPCTWMSVVILSAMLLVVVGSFPVRWPNMPIDPTTVAGAMYYASDPTVASSVTGSSPSAGLLFGRVDSDLV